MVVAACPHVLNSLDTSLLGPLSNNPSTAHNTSPLSSSTTCQHHRDSAESEKERKELFSSLFSSLFSLFFCTFVVDVDSYMKQKGQCNNGRKLYQPFAAQGLKWLHFIRFWPFLKHSTRFPEAAGCWLLLVVS